MKWKIWNGILVGVVFVFVFVNIAFINVVLHEWGHFVAADHYGLEPEIEYEFQNMTGVRFSFEGVPIAYTSFLDNGNNLEIIGVALMGPFFNLVLGIAFMFVFIYCKEMWYVKEFGLVGAITSIGSGLMNLLPFSGSDGALVLELL
jgi:hypothetical protein